MTTKTPRPAAKQPSTPAKPLSRGGAVKQMAQMAKLASAPKPPKR